jgi:hypothetical protein
MTLLITFSILHLPLAPCHSRAPTCVRVRIIHPFLPPLSCSLMHHGCTALLPVCEWIVVLATHLAPPALDRAKLESLRHRVSPPCHIRPPATAHLPARATPLRPYRSAAQLLCVVLRTRAANPCAPTPCAARLAVVSTHPCPPSSHQTPCSALRYARPAGYLAGRDAYPSARMSASGPPHTSG